MGEPNVSQRAEDEARELAERGRAWAQRDRYVLVLVMIVCSLISTAFLADGIWGLVASLGFMSATLLVTLSTSDAGPKTVYVARAAVLISITGIVVADLFNYTGIARLALVVTMLVLSTLTPLVIARRLQQHPVISVNTVAGAADIYLLVGLFYTVLFSLIGGILAGSGAVLSSTGFSHAAAAGAFFSASRPVGPADFVYFSFTTLTTVGYGDLTATTDLGRLLSDTEALFGQLYLVTVVALIVANVGRSRVSKAEQTPDEISTDRNPT